MTREREDWLMAHSVEAIADRWVVSTAKVRTQVRGILTKLRVGTQLAAVARAW